MPLMLLDFASDLLVLMLALPFSVTCRIVDRGEKQNGLFKVHFGMGEAAIYCFVSFQYNNTCFPLLCVI